MPVMVFCRKVAEAVYSVMNAAVGGYVECRWLYAVPLYHFLSNTVKVFARTPENGSASHRQPWWWGIADFVKIVERFKVLQKGNM